MRTPFPGIEWQDERGVCHTHVQDLLILFLLLVVFEGTNPLDRNDGGGETHVPIIISILIRSAAGVVNRLNDTIWRDKE